MASFLLSPEGQCLWFSLGCNFPLVKFIFMCVSNDTKMYYNLDIHFINPYETDTLPIPRLWCEISTSEYPCPHYDIPEDLKPAKLLTLKMWSRENLVIWVLTSTFFIHRPCSHTPTLRNILNSITLRFLSSPS